MSRPISDPVFDIGRDLQRAYDDGYKQGRYDEKVETEKSLPKWIPCSDRLPEENEVVLTQARFADDIKMAVSARIDYNYWTGWGTREVNVVAWMPLPPVYQEEDNK